MSRTQPRPKQGPALTGRRQFLRRQPGRLARWSLVLQVGLLSRPSQAATILSVRVWPARDYTRVTLELDRPLRFTQNLLPDPPRMVIDLEPADLDSEIRELVSKVKSDDPYIAQVRVGQLRPGVVRLVFDMKEPVKPQLFALEPVANYRHRLVLDLYPQSPPDPLKALLEQIDRPAGNSAGSKPAPGDNSRSETGKGGAPGAGKSARPEPAPPAPGHDPLAELIRERERAQASASGSGDQNSSSGAVTRRSEPRIIRLVTVALDPGHGGEDPGAVGRAGTFEKDVVLSIGQLLREMINREPNMRAYMTRDADFFVPLATRVEKARRVQADLFVSIHADAFVEPAARGASVFVLSDKSASSTAARWLANKENGADLIGGANLKASSQEAARVLLDMSTKTQIRDSTRLGEVVLSNLGEVGKLHKRGVERAGFAVLRAPDIPSILVETAFISNPQEERRLGDPAYQQQVAAAIFKGIKRYFLRYPPPPRQRSST